MRLTIGKKFLLGFTVITLILAALVALMFLYSRREMIRIIGPDQDPSRAVQALEHHALLVSSAALVFIILVVLIIFRNITARVRDLQRVSAEFSHGNFTARAEVRSSDELGQVGLLLNEMASRLEGSRKILEEENKELESQVAAHTKELRGKLDELGKANQLMVGRELRMMELKKEIDRLKKAPE